MNKKLMLLAAGALAAVALAALPAMASAGEFSADCKSGANCSGKISGGEAEIENNKGERVKCTGTEGTANVSHGTSTGQVNLIFTNCREQVTIFKFTCTNTATAGKIETGSLQTHLIYIEPQEKTPGFLITSLNVTFNCAGWAKMTVTGSLIGHIENPNCGSFKPSHQVEFARNGIGEQTYWTITTTGAGYYPISNKDIGDTYLESSITATGTFTWTNDEVKLTCK